MRYANFNFESYQVASLTLVRLVRAGNTESEVTLFSPETPLAVLQMLLLLCVLGLPAAFSVCELLVSEFCIKVGLRRLMLLGGGWW